MCDEVARKEIALDALTYQVIKTLFKAKIVQFDQLAQVTIEN